MNEQKLRKLALEGVFWSKAQENLGVYPQAITGGPNAYTKRTERMEGWNEAGTKLLKNYSALESWYEAVPEQFRELVTELLLEDRLELHTHEKECELYVNCSDTFYWGCSDGEEIIFEELPALADCYALSPTCGGELWCARKRGMRPQRASYVETYPRAEWALFDACGPSRTDPDGKGREELDQRTTSPP